MYNIKTLLTREPVAVSGTVKTLVLVAVVFRWIDWDDVQLAAVLVALETVLSLLYVRPTSTPNAQLKENLEALEAVKEEAKAA